MNVIYISVGFFMLVIGLCTGAITALIIRFINKKSAVASTRSYTQKDREQFQIDQETLLNSRRDYSAECYK